MLALHPFQARHERGFAEVTLTSRHQDVDIVAAHKVVRQANDGALQAGLPMVVCCVSRHKARKLRHLCMHEERFRPAPSMYVTLKSASSNTTLQAGLSMAVRCVSRHEARQLRHLCVPRNSLN